MCWVLVRHKVADYDTWRPFFDGADSLLRNRALGVRKGHVFRSSSDPNELWILLEWENAEQAHEFMDAPDLRAVMGQSGVIDTPDIYFFEELPKPKLEAVATLATPY